MSENKISVFTDSSTEPKSFIMIFSIPSFGGREKALFSRSFEGYLNEMCQYWPHMFLGPWKNPVGIEGLFGIKA